MTDVAVRKIPRQIYDRLPDLHRLTVDLLVIDGEWEIVDNDDKTRLK